MVEKSLKIPYFSFLNIPFVDYKTRADLDSEVLRENYKQAIKQYQKSLEEENYIVSFILATTLYEERLNICYLLLFLKEYDTYTIPNV